MKLSLARLAFLSDFGDRILELGEVFKVFVDRGETDVGNLVEALQFLHDELADVAGIDFALSAGEQFFLDGEHGRVDGGGGHRTLAQRQHQTAAQLGGGELGAVAVLLDDEGHDQLDALIRGKSFITFSAAPTAAYRVALLRYARIEDLRVFVLAERTFHGRRLLRVEAAPATRPALRYY